MSKTPFFPIIIVLALTSALVLPRCQVTPPQQTHPPQGDTVITIPDTMVSIPDNPPLPDTVVSLPDTVIHTEGKKITVCSFNIQFLGHFKKKDNKALADLLKTYDIVIIQEMVAPPVNGTYPDGSSYSADPESKAFLEAMEFYGFSSVLSDEDTGPVATIHTNSTSTEWWIAFYRDETVDLATDLPHGFLATDRSANTDYERVPYAFPFRIDGTNVDFVLISVHLAPDASGATRRKAELNAIDNWINDHDDIENDFIILGDMNIEDADELAENTPEGFISLNNECYRTNTLINQNPGNGAKPYDHVMYRPVNTSEEIDEDFDIQVVDLVEIMESSWNSTLPYPGNPYNHNEFKQYFSDHHPLVFKIGE